MDPTTQELIRKIENAVHIIMDASVTRQARQEAQQFCEEFRENYLLTVECGFILAEKQRKPFIRHFGLQLVEHCIKFNWNNLPAEKKIFIKDTTVQYIINGTDDILEEQVYIKDVISRIMVEMAKREWPQHWPSFIDELEKLAEMGPIQTELVLFIWLRLVEDAVTFQSIQQQRRRDIYATIVASMNRLMSFFLMCLKTNVEQYKALREESPNQSAIHCRLAKSVLTTLCGFVDWVSIDYITENDNMLLQMLCILFADSELQLNAADCLLQIVNRKGKPEERKPLLVLFCEDAMQAILLATEQAASAKLDEYHYQFMKKLTQVLTGIGGQLTVLWGAEKTVTRPENFDKYLDAILALAAHPSQMLGGYTQVVLFNFLRHEQIKDDPDLLKRLRTILDIGLNALLKVGHPSQSNHPSCAYAQLDFDADDEFSQFFCKYRSEASDTIRQITIVNPVLAFDMMSQSLEALLKSQDLNGVGDYQGAEHTSFMLRWEAMTILVENVMSRLVRDPSMVAKGTELLKLCLYYNSNDPMLLSYNLSLISALFPFLNEANDLLPSVLEKLFSSIVCNPDSQPKAARSKRVKNVRRHACSVLVKVCKEHPKLLMPAFEHLYRHIKTLMNDPEQLSTLERCTLNESLILISNHFCQFDKQSSFIEEMLLPVKTMWLSTEFTSAFQSSASLMSFVGLDSAPVEPSSADSCGINRSRILYCLGMVQSILKRSTCPEDPEVAKSGGFVLDVQRSNGGIVYKNPATQHIEPMLQNVLLLIKSFHGLWLPENLARRHPEFANSYDLNEIEKKSILGIPVYSNIDSMDVSVPKTPLERMMNFMIRSADALYRTLSESSQCLGYQYYSVPNLTAMLEQSVFTNLDVLPDFHLRNLIRLSVKYHVLNCPQERCVTDALPVLSIMCPFMHTKLTKEWQLVNQRLESVVQQDEEADPESQEIFEEQLTRRLTRDYIDMLGTFIIPRASDYLEQESSGTEDAVMEGESTNTQQTPRVETISPLGQQLLNDNSICTPIVLTLFNALSWSDTVTCNKALMVCWRVFRQLMIQDFLSSSDGCYLLEAVFLSLQLQGQHEGMAPNLMTLAMQLFDAMVPVFPNVTLLLKQIPTYDDRVLQTYLECGPQRVGSRGDKKRKENFKSLIAGAVGKSVGQQFRREVDIKDLPRMFGRNRPKNRPLVEQVQTDIGLHSLFKPEDEDENSDANM